MFLDKDDDSIPLLGSSRRSSNCSVYSAGIVACLLGLSAGITIAWTSPVLPQLTDDDNPLGRPITTEEESWLTGLLHLGAVASPLLAGPMADKIGRKRTLLLVTIPMVLSFLLVALTRTILVWYVARFLMGMGAGGAITILPIYLNEISEDHNRGCLGGFMTVSISAGTLYTYALGPLFTIQGFSFVCLVPLLLFFPLFALLNPETPQFAALRNDRKTLEASLRRLRAKTFDEIKKEMAKIEETALELGHKPPLMELLRSKAMTITFGLMGLQQFSGITAVTSYLQTILEEARGVPAPGTATTIIGVLQLGATILASVLVDRVGRRILLLVSSIGACLSLVLLAAYFQVRDYSVAWLSVVGLVFYMVHLGVGVVSLPWTIMAELFPPKLKPVAATLGSIACFLGAFFTTFAFPLMTLTLGMPITFGILASSCASGAIFIYWILPETKGKSVQQIQQILGSDKSLDTT